MGIKDTISRGARKLQLVPTPDYPDLDGQVFVRKLTVNERHVIATSPEESFWREFLFRAVVEADGSQAFLSIDEVNVVLGDRADSDLVEHILESARAFCLPTKKFREDTEKNSETGRTGDLPSGSAEPSESSTPTSSETS